MQIDKYVQSLLLLKEIMIKDPAMIIIGKYYEIKGLLREFAKDERLPLFKC
jgi:hypothetical protein